MAACQRRDLGGINLLVLMIDGLHVDGRVILVALGIDTEGKKHVLGLREGATESSTSCKALLDGNQALAKAIGAVFLGDHLKTGHQRSGPDVELLPNDRSHRTQRGW